MNYEILHERRTGSYVLIDVTAHKIIGYYDTYEEAKQDAEAEEAERKERK